jgi:hypothetical protein
MTQRAFGTHSISFGAAACARVYAMLFRGEERRDTITHHNLAVESFVRRCPFARENASFREREGTSANGHDVFSLRRLLFNERDFFLGDGAFPSSEVRDRACSFNLKLNSNSTVT